MKSISAAVHQFQNNVDTLSDEQFRAAVLSVFGNIVRDTPVDTGRLRNSWQEDKTAEREYTISNRLPYAQAIENGHSKRAPHGMMQKNIEKWPEIVANMKIP